MLPGFIFPTTLQSGPGLRKQPIRTPPGYSCIGVQTRWVGLFDEAKRCCFVFSDLSSASCLGRSIDLTLASTLRPGSPIGPCSAGTVVHAALLPGHDLNKHVPLWVCASRILGDATYMFTCALSEPVFLATLASVRLQVNSSFSPPPKYTPRGIGGILLPGRERKPASLGSCAGEERWQNLQIWTLLITCVARSSGRERYILALVRGRVRSSRIILTEFSCRLRK